ncbi:MAG: insulinase family protein [Vicinamibacteria bacterium]|jgi:predicted Zn-dependent peptidase|nr:insulinase family protein [Vicinamibacteria bacterium]
MNMKRAGVIFLTLVWVAGTTVPSVAGPALDGTLKLPAYTKRALPNGMTVLLMEQHEVPFISLAMLIRPGAAVDPPGKAGLADLTLGLLRKGTERRSAEQISLDLDFIGGDLSTQAGHDAMSVSAEFLKKDFDQGLDLVQDILLHPTFPEAEFENLRRQALDGILADKDQPQNVSGLYFNHFLFGAHPYGQPSGGDEQTLAALTRQDVVDFYQARFAPTGTILAVAGDFATEDMLKRIEGVFGAWTRKAAPVPKLPAPRPRAGRRLLLVDKPDATQTYIRVGQVGIPRNHPDRVAVTLINILLGGRFTSRLNTELRIQSGLTYGARSYFDRRVVAGPFGVSTYTANANTVRAMDIILKILRRLQDEGISAEELQSAKAYLKGQYAPSIESSAQLAAMLSDLELHGLDQKEIDTLFARIDAVTLSDTRRVIRACFPLKDLSLVWIGQAAEIEASAKRYATHVERKPISERGF